MTKDEALRLALEALVMLLDNYVPEATEEDISQVETTITAIKAALEAEDEPVVCWDSDGWGDLLVDSLPDGTLLYTTPPQRKPLTDEEMWNLWNSQGSDDMTQKEAIAFARAIEAAHGITGDNNG